MSSRCIEVADSITIMDRIRSGTAAEKAAHDASSGKEISSIDVLRAIVEEVAGHGQPFSADSYLPSHLIHDARQVIEQYEREQEAK